jgi:hypothetical protein
MSGPAFTPGSWEYTATVAMHDRPDLPCVVDEHRLVVAQCWDDGHTEDECEANARLIAAAPELYTKLEEWAALVESCQVGGIGVHAFAHETRKLLAKARGERA